MSAWLLYDDTVAPDAPLAVSAWLAAGAGERVLSAWPDEKRRPHPLARRCDPRLLDGSGGAAWVSLLWPDRDRLPLFDDPAVLQARRAALRELSPRAVSTLTVDSQRWAGSLWVADTAGAVAGDPFQLLGVPLVLEVAPGLLSAGPAQLVGPTVERYAGAPWPAGDFAVPTLPDRQLR